MHAQEDYALRILTFEDGDAQFSPYHLNYADKDINTWSDLIDEDQYGGSLLYGQDGSGMGDPYYWQDKDNTELMYIMPFYVGEYSFFNGGHAISNYAAGDCDNWENYNNQLSVYGTGGHNGSDNFAICACLNPSAPPRLSFGDGVPRVIDHMYVNISTMLRRYLLEHNTSSEWINIVAIGYDQIGNEISNAIFTLSKGGTKNMVADWTKWDLSTLGEVAYVDFLMTQGSDYTHEGVPAIFAYDDVAVRFDKQNQEDNEDEKEDNQDEQQDNTCLEASILLPSDTTIFVDLNGAFTVYRIHISEWKEKQVTMAWSGSSTLHTFFAKTCTFAVAPYHRNVIHYHTIAPTSNWILTPQQLTTWEPLADNKGWVYLRLLTEYPGKLTIKQ